MPNIINSSILVWVFCIQLYVLTSICMIRFYNIKVIKRNKYFTLHRCCLLCVVEDWLISDALSLNNINVLLYLNSSIFSIINIQWNHRVNWPSFSTLYKNEPPLSLVKSWIVIADTTQTFLKLEQTIEMCSLSFSFPTGFLFQSAFNSQ